MEMIPLLVELEIIPLSGGDNTAVGDTVDYSGVH
jgi:hypothetical protein